MNRGKSSSGGMFSKMKKGMSKALASAHVDQISMHSVAKSASSLWNKVVSGASQMLGVTDVLTDASADVLSVNYLLFAYVISMS